VKIEFYANLRDIVGKSEIEKELTLPVSLADTLLELAEKYGNEMRELLLNADDTISNNIMVIVNGCQVNKAETIYLSDSDEMSILLPLAGG